MSLLSNNIIYNLTGQSILLFLSLFAVKYIFSQLGGDALGIIYFTVLLNRILCGLLSKGLCAPAVREVSTYHTVEPDYIRNFIQTGSLICWAIFVVFSITIFISAPYLVDKWITLNTLNNSIATTVLRILGLGTLLAFPISFYLSIVQGLQRMEISNFLDVVSAIIEQLGIIVVLLYNGQLVLIASWIFLSRCFKVVAYLSVTAFFFGTRSILPNYSKTAINRNSRFAINMIAISIFVFANKQADKIIVSKMLPINVFGYYGYIYELVSKALYFTVVVAQAAYPSFCELSNERSRTMLIKQYLKLQDFVCFIMVPLFAAISFFSMPILKFVFNEEVAKMLLFPITLLCFGAYMNGTLSLPHRVLLAFGKPEIAAKQYMYAFFIAVPLIAIFTYFWGLAGASSSLILIYLVGYIYMVPRVFRKCLKLPVWKFFIHIMRISFLSFCSYGLVFIFIAVTQRITFFYLIVAYITASIVFILGAYFMLSDELRKYMSIQYVKGNLIRFLRFS